MNNLQETAMPLVKVQDKGQVTLPSKLRQQVGIAVGDYVKVEKDGSRIVLIPQVVSERHPKIDRAIAEGLADVRAGRLSPKFASTKEYRAWLKTPEGKKFAAA
jgi:AbrB family looped-hinge helix DNA binding protein